jgi:hypothetical protein
MLLLSAFILVSDIDPKETRAPPSEIYFTILALIQDSSPADADELSNSSRKTLIEFSLYTLSVEWYLYCPVVNFYEDLEDQMILPMMDHLRELPESELEGAISNTNFKDALIKEVLSLYNSEIKLEVDEVFLRCIDVLKTYNLAN